MKHLLSQSAKLTTTGPRPVLQLVSRVWQSYISFILSICSSQPRDDLDRVQLGYAVRLDEREREHQRQTQVGCQLSGTFSREGLYVIRYLIEVPVTNFLLNLQTASAPEFLDFWDLAPTRAPPPPHKTFVGSGHASLDPSGFKARTGLQATGRMPAFHLNHVLFHPREWVSKRRDEASRLRSCWRGGFFIEHHQLSSQA